MGLNLSKDKLQGFFKVMVSRLKHLSVTILVKPE